LTSQNLLQLWGSTTAAPLPLATPLLYVLCGLLFPYALPVMLMVDAFYIPAPIGRFIRCIS
jgi:hypothetical protein